MITFTKTRSAAGYISHHTSSDLARSRTLVLVKRLGVCEAALAAAGGDPGLAQSLLRGLVLTVRELAGPAWLAANTDDPDIAAFTALGDAPTPLPPGDLDEILARVLWARFTPRPAVTVPGQRTGPGSAEPLLSGRTGRSPGRCRIRRWRLFSRPRPGQTADKVTAITCPDPERRPASELRPVRGGGP